MRAAVIFLLVGYVVFKVFRFVFGSSSKTKTAFNKSAGQADPNVHRNQHSSKSKKDGKSFQGGEYVDYEEVD